MAQLTDKHAGVGTITVKVWRGRKTISYTQEVEAKQLSSDPIIGKYAARHAIDASVRYHSVFHENYGSLLTYIQIWRSSRAGQP